MPVQLLLQDASGYRELSSLVWGMMQFMHQIKTSMRESPELRLFKEWLGEARIRSFDALLD